MFTVREILMLLYEPVRAITFKRLGASVKIRGSDNELLSIVLVERIS